MRRLLLLHLAAWSAAPMTTASIVPPNQIIFVGDESLENYRTQSTSGSDANSLLDDVGGVPKQNYRPNYEPFSEIPSSEFVLDDRQPNSQRPDNRGPPLDSPDGLFINKPSSEVVLDQRPPLQMISEQGRPAHGLPYHRSRPLVSTPFEFEDGPFSDIPSSEFILEDRPSHVTGDHYVRVYDRDRPEAQRNFDSSFGDILSGDLSPTWKKKIRKKDLSREQERAARWIESVCRSRGARGDSHSVCGLCCVLHHVHSLLSAPHPHTSSFLERLLATIYN